MAGIFSRALPFAARPPLPLATVLYRSLAVVPTSLAPLHSSAPSSSSSSSSISLFSHPGRWGRRGFIATLHCSGPVQPFADGILATLSGFRKSRRRNVGAASEAKEEDGGDGGKPPKEKEVELFVQIDLDDDMPDDPEVLSIVELLRLNAPMVMKIALDGLHDSQYKTRDTSIGDAGNYEKIELSVKLCNDRFIRGVNKELRGEDCVTDVISVSQHIPDFDYPTLFLGDVVISVETAARQAEERSLTLIDEVRILMIHGLLHLLGFDHEISDEAAAEMEKEEQVILRSLGWKGKGLIRSAHESGKLHTSHGQATNDLKKASSLRFYKPKFSHIFCDMDGTLLNSKSLVTETTAEALREAISRGVKIVIATGKSRPAVISALKMVGLAGKNAVVSDSSPGVFLQGLLVYGNQGREIYRRSLGADVCRKAFSYALEHEVPLVAFSQDQCFTPFDHPLVDSLHLVYHEPKAKVTSSIEELLATAEIQKLLFVDTAEGVSSILRPYWTEETEGQGAGVVQAQPDMLEIIPAGTSKGSGVKMLLDHLGISSKEIMAIGDGENDVEMLQLASLSVALANGSDKAKAVADVIGVTNDEDGAAKAIFEYAF